MQDTRKNLMQHMTDALKAIDHKINHMKNKAATITITSLLLISCSQIKTVEQDQASLDLSKAHSVEFYGKSWVNPDCIVRMETHKDREQELLHKLSQLYNLEHPKEESVLTISILPTYDYELYCKASFDNTEQEVGFSIRNRTYLGNKTTYQFDARQYFTEDSWQKLRIHFDNDYNREIDIKTVNNTGTPLPGKEE